MNPLNDILEELLKRNGGQEDQITMFLRKKIKEMGDDPTKEEVENALEELKKLLREMLMRTGITSPDDEEDERSEDDAEKAVVETADAIEAFLNSKEYKFERVVINPTVIVFHYELGIGDESTGKEMDFTVNIVAETKPDVVKIDIILPFKPTKTTELAVCKAIAKVNYCLRFGSFKYDEEDGEIKFSLSFITKNGTTLEEIALYYRLCITTAFNESDAIKDAVDGAFTLEEKSELRRNITGLLMSIDD